MAKIANIQAWEKALAKFIASYRGRPEISGALLCGSYAQGTYTRNSDIDVHFILRRGTLWRERGNRKVEFEKSRETSLTRKFAILGLTYVLMTLVFFMLGVEKFLLNALVPTLGYYLSTQSIPILKKIWLRHQLANTRAGQLLNNFG